MQATTSNDDTNHDDLEGSAAAFPAVIEQGSQGAGSVDSDVGSDTLSCPFLVDSCIEHTLTGEAERGRARTYPGC